MKYRSNPELAKAINQTAHLICQQSFASIRQTLSQKANILLKEGKGLDETMQAIRATGLRGDVPQSR